MEQIGLYKQLTPWTSQGAGTAEWCKGEKDGKPYFLKKFLSPVYPSKDLGLPERKYLAKIARFHNTEASIKTMYDALRDNDTSGTLVVPEEVISYQYHICTVAPFVAGNVSPDQACQLSEWQRLVLMRTLTLALNNVHRAGVVHCDMKPENVLINQNAENGSCALKLIDFDGSFMEYSPPEDISGDPAYFAPEGYAMSTMPGIRLTRKIDIFALGIIFHYFWTGKLPEKDPDVTLGQFILRGNKPTIDPAIPAPLQAIIAGCLEADPDKRINGEEIYNGLEQMLPDYPVKIINLQKNPKEPAKTAPRPERTSGTEKTGREEKTASLPKKLTVTVKDLDSSGTTLYTRDIEVEYGKTVSVFARTIAGYELKSSRVKIDVSVDKDGKASENPVRFIYEKPKPGKAKYVILAILAVALAYCLTMYALAQSSYDKDDYVKAKTYMDLFPFYQEFFTDQYEHTTRSIIRQKYGEAVEQYRNGKYTAAYLSFKELNGYEKSELYMSFCQAHTGSAVKQFDIIYNHIDFEDAKELLLKDSDIGFEFLFGTWRVRGGSSEFDFRAYRDGNQSFMSNLPDSPGGGYWNIREGAMYYVIDGKEIKLHSMVIISKDDIIFTSNTTGTIYRLTRK